MSNKDKIDFSKAPERLIELLGARAEELLTAWFAAAGYQRPKGWYVSLFPSMSVVKKKTGAIDASLSLDMSYYLTEDDEVPSARIRISSFISDEIQDDHYPTIEISLGSGSEEKLFIFCAGKWTEGR